MSFELVPETISEFRYASKADMQAAYGDKTLIEWTNLLPKQSIIDDARLILALKDAQDEIDRRLTNSAYAVPLTNLSDSDARYICDIACKLAMVWLYDHRPGTAIDEEGRPKTQGRSMKKDVDRRILNLYAGQYKLEATRRINTPSFGTTTT